VLGGALGRLSIALIWAPLTKAVQVIAQILGGASSRNNALIECFLESAS